MALLHDIKGLTSIRVSTFGEPVVAVAFSPLLAYSVFMANQVVTTELVLASSTASAEFSSIPLPTVEPSPLCPLCPFLAERFEVYRQIAYWKAMHQRAWQREQKLQQRITGPEKGTGTFFIAPIFPSP